MASEAKKRADAKYDKEHTIQFKMKLNKVKDAEIIDWLNAQPNKQGAIKDLIKREIKRQE